MNEIVPPLSSDLLLAKYNEILDLGRSVKVGTPERDLIPEADIRPLMDAIAATMRPANRRQIAEHLAVIEAVWWSAASRPSKEMQDIRTEKLGAEMAKIPSDILTSVIRELYCTSKWYPTISEVIVPATAALAKREKAYQLVWRHQCQHEELKRQRAESAARRQAEREHLQGRLDRLVELHGDTARRWTVDDLQDANNGVCKGVIGDSSSHEMYTRWQEATAAGRLWTLLAMPVAIVMGRACPWDGPNRVTDRQLYHLLQMASQGDYTAALAGIEDPASIPDDGEIRFPCAEFRLILSGICRRTRGKAEPAA
jgi:hypothetical protein